MSISISGLKIVLKRIDDVSYKDQAKTLIDERMICLPNTMFLFLSETKVCYKFIVEAISNQKVKFSGRCRLLATTIVIKHNYLVGKVNSSLACSIILISSAAPLWNGFLFEPRL